VRVWTLASHLSVLLSSYLMLRLTHWIQPARKYRAGRQETLFSIR
jgi:hypothetical protein